MGKAFVSGGAAMTAPVGLPALSTVAVGSSVYLNENGSPVEYLVVHQGKPSSLYDASCDGVWLLRKDVYENRVWDSTNNDYANSDIHSYLNSTFLKMFDVDIQSAIKQAKIPYRKGTGNGTATVSGSNGLSTKIFLLSATEVGFNHSYMPSKEGVELSYFSGCADDAADNKRIAYLNDSAIRWWTRSPECATTGNVLNVISVYPSGVWGSYNCTAACGIRPALILPSTARVADDGIIKI